MRCILYAPCGNGRVIVGPMGSFKPVRTMKPILRTLTSVLVLSTSAALAQPAIINQGASDTFVAFEAEHYAYVSNALPTFWVATNDVPASGTPASGGRALYQAGEPQNTGMSSSFAYYALEFATPGSYSLYVRWRADQRRSDQDGNGDQCDNRDRKSVV